MSYFRQTNNTMIRVFLAITLAFICFFSNAQNEGNNWYFGNFGGLSFNTNPPSVLNDGQLFTSEGCTAISDEDGVLLFYSDGITVWDANHDIMPNGTGLLGNPSSTQSGVIVKKPGDNPIYYLFAVAAEGGTAGLTYSEVDMSLNGGLGDVTFNKNIEIVSPTCEKVVAITHSNGADFWIVTHLYNSADYHSYLLTDDGLDNTPIVTTIGEDVGTSISNTIGYLKSSLDGSMVVSAGWTLDVVELFHFDNATGVLSDLISIDNLNAPYGVEFSPDGQVLYVSEISDSFGDSSVFQYDISSYNEQDIEDSRITLDSSTSGYGALQVGPDLKIYLAFFGNFLGAINQPNTLGTGCDFELEAIDISPGNTVLGLPTFYNAAFISNSVSFQNTCLGDITQFTLANNEVDSVLWNFDDPDSGLDNTSTLTSPTHIFTAAGTFDVSVISYFEEIADTVFNAVTIYAIPDLDLGPPLSNCEGETIILSADQEYDNYLWEDQSNSPILSVTESGNYSLTISENGCLDTDSVDVSFIPYPIVDLGPDTLICQDQPYLLDATTAGATYEWSDNSTNSTLTVSNAGVYSVDVSVTTCTSSDEVVIQTEDCTSVLIMPNVFSPNGDDYNSRFLPIVALNVKSPELKVYNRWGILVYESTNLNQGWNGKFNSNDCSDGSYFWVITYNEVDGTEKKQNGSVTLLH